ncbi:tyrosine-type recombinase/integrase [Ferrimonas marina]|uniref:Phage integrase family protein n=1 Tax=Ferrimonas marina TaxID=299255 RepID=A0A1M5ZY12_9GAMM|nr:site-specific integrase [Ferrimonas marina]SHI28773.1 Phage integrase family protein [Ferrimonas marina]
MEIISYELREWEYRQPEVYIDDNGEAQVRYIGEAQQIGPITLLYQVVFDDSGKVTHSEPVEAANAYLMYQKIYNEAQCLSVAWRALKHYFTFLANENATRAAKNAERRELGQDELPYLSWNAMPLRENQRPTYRYRQCLKDCYKSEDPDVHLARSTANAYMNRVVDFYKHYIKHGFQFEHPPFQYELVSISVGNDYRSMKAQRRMEVHTTDLRLKLPKDRRKRPSPLTALAPYQWEALDNILRNTRKILTKRDGQLVLSRFPIEFSLVFLVMRWTGLRREEALTLRAGQIFKPNERQLRRGYVEIDVGPSVGVETKFDKHRTIEMPAELMVQIYDYLQSPRYIKRRNKHRDTLTTNQRLFGNYYLFLNENGQPYAVSTLNSRWSDIRRTLAHNKLGLGEPFEHKAHNLRPSYAVERWINLVDHGVDEGKAFRHIQDHLGHDEEDTTRDYMRQAQDRRNGRRSPQEVFENVIDFHFKQGAFALTGASDGL